MSTGYVPKLTQPQRADRRREIAQWAVDRGGTTTAIGLAVEHFKVCRTTVVKALKEVGAPIARSTPISVYRILADLITTDLPVRQIAENRGCSPENVYRIAQTAENVGIPLKDRQNARRKPDCGAEQETLRADQIG